MAEQTKPIRTCDLNVLKSMLLSDETLPDLDVSNKNDLMNDNAKIFKSEDLNQHNEDISTYSNDKSNNFNDIFQDENSENMAKNKDNGDHTKETFDNKENQEETKEKSEKSATKNKRKKKKVKQSKIKSTIVEHSNRRLQFGRLDQPSWQESDPSQNRLKSAAPFPKSTPMSSQSMPQNHHSQRRLPPTRIVSNEERLNEKYAELENLLSRDLLQETSEICHQTVREARQLLHSSLAATRIISEPINEASQYSTTTKLSRTRTRSNEEKGHTPRSESSHVLKRASRDRSRDSYDNEESIKSHSRRQRVKSGSSQKQYSNFNQSKESKLNERRHDKEGFSFPSPRPQIRRDGVGFSTGTYLYGFGVERPEGFAEMQQKRMAKGSDSQLSKTDNPFIQRWLKRKNRLIREQKRMKKEDDRLEKELDEEIEIIKQQRAQISARYYQNWFQKKTKDLKQSHIDQPKKEDDSTDSEEEEEEEAGDGDGRVMGRRPQTAPHHVHNYVYKRGPASPMKPIAGFGAPKKKIGIKISGRKLQTPTDSKDDSNSRQEALNKLRISYDDWLKAKHIDFQNQKLRREAAESAARAEAHIDEDLKNIVPEMARRRIQNKRNLAKRSTPFSQNEIEKSEKPMDKDETEEKSTDGINKEASEEHNYIWRADSEGNLIRLSSTTELTGDDDKDDGYRPVTSMDRRVDEITSDHPNPYSKSDNPLSSFLSTHGQHQDENHNHHHAVNKRIADVQELDKLESSLIERKVVTALPPTSPNKSDLSHFECPRESRISGSYSPARSSTRSINEDSDVDEVLEDFEFDADGSDAEDADEDNSQIPKLNLAEFENEDNIDDSPSSHQRDSIDLELVDNE